MIMNNGQQYTYLLGKSAGVLHLQINNRQVSNQQVSSLQVNNLQSKRLPQYKQKGVALITVMLIVALSAVILMQMTSRLQMQMQRTENIVLNQQAYWYAMGAEAFAKRILITSFSKEKDVTNLSQPWAKGETTFPVEFGEITGEIKDLQSCLNLNALRKSTGSDIDDITGGRGSGRKATDSKTSAGDVNGKRSNEKPPARAALQELLVLLDIKDVSTFEAEYMVDALSDWLDADSSIESAGGAEDNDYASREFPLLPANNFIGSVKELRVIEHFTIAALVALKDYVCVIPNSDLHKININTISNEEPALLQALLGGITKSEAEQLLSARESEGFKDIETFLNLPEVVKLKLSPEQKQQFVVDSEYFTVKTTASFNNSYFALNSIMKVENNDQISVVSRTIGRD